ncbi:MAG: MmgE/PrpD family protein, partial [Chloroflexi bacterium]|nr:MmgE/PrpD family protein [Chloroflexota bacterium]
TFTGGTTEGARAGGQEMMYHEPNATRNGIMAALLAQENVRGSETALEGDAGFYNAFTGNNRGELSYVFQGPQQTELPHVTADLGSRWELLHVTPKIYQTAGYNCPVIDLMTQIRSRHDLLAPDVSSITVDMNWLETLYPSPAFPSQQRGTPGFGSTHFFAAYTFVHGAYPPLKARINPGEVSSGEQKAVMDLLQRVDVVGHKDRPAFAPRITIRMHDGTTYQGEYTGNELEWDLATETNRISAIFDDMNWPRQQLEAIVDTVSRLDEQPRVDELIQLCVRG